MANKFLVDGFISAVQGMNESVSPNLLTNNELARCVNIDVSLGVVATRYGFNKIALWTSVQPWVNYAGEEVDPMDYFRNGKFQGATLYRFQEHNYLVLVVGQLIWRINLATCELELYGWAEHIKDIPKVNLLTWRCWFCQVESFMLIQDGVNPPYILTGRSIRQSKGVDVKGEIGTDAQMLKNTNGIVDNGAVIPLAPIYDTESYRVKVLMSAMVTDLAVGDYCTVRFRNDTTETGIITKVNQYADTPYYEIKFETIRDWTKYGMKRFDNVAGSGETIYHGMVSVGRLEVPEVPAGTAMAYGHGRIFVVYRDKYIMAGDILKSWKPESVLKFTEIGSVNGGGALGVPVEMGNIVNLAFMPNAETSTGYGPLIALCENGACSFFVQQPRDTWFNTDISKVLFMSNGCASQYGACQINNDLIYIAYDGLRSLRHSYSTVAQSNILQNLSLSNNIKQVWRESAQWAWKYSSVCNVDNNVYFTSKAFRGYKYEDIPNKISDEDNAETREPIEETRMRAIVACRPITYSASDSLVVFDGIWTGYDFLQVISGNLRGVNKLLAIARDDSGNLCVLYPGTIRGLDSGKSSTKCRVYTPAYDFLSGVDISTDTYGRVIYAKSLLKRFEYMDIWLSEIYGRAVLSLYCRPLGYAGWVFCGTLAVEAETSPSERVNTWTQFRRKQRISAPRLQCDSVTGWDLMTSSAFQFCIEWEGGLQIDRALFFASLLPEEKNFACVQPQGRMLSSTWFNDYDYIAKET